MNDVAIFNDRWGAFKQKAKQAGYSDDEIEAYRSTAYAPTLQRMQMRDAAMKLKDQANNQPAPKKKSNPLLGFIPLATSLAGGAVGTLAGPLGTAAGGAAGGAVGEWLRQKLSGEQTSGGKIALEGGMGALGGLGKAAGAISGASKVLKAGEGTSAAIKALKYADTAKDVGTGVKAAAGAASVASDLSTASTVAKGGKGVRGWLAGKLGGAADSTAMKSVRVNPSQATKFEREAGENLGSFLRTNKLTGKTADDIRGTTLKSLNQQFGEQVGGIGRPLTVEDIVGSSKDRISGLLKSEAPEIREKGQKVIKNITQMLERNGGKLDAATVNKARGEFDSLVNYTTKMADPAKYGVNKETADVLRRTLQGADPTGKLKETGLKIRNTRNAANIVEKQANLGKGTGGLGLRDMLAAGAGGGVGAASGGAAGGLPGMAAGVAVQRAANSPKVLSYVSRALGKGAEKAAGKAGTKAATEATAKGTLKSMAKIQGGIKGLQFMGNSAAPDPSNPLDEVKGMSVQEIMDSGLVGGGEEPSAGGELGAGEMGGDMPQAESYSKAALMADMQRDPENANKYIAMYNALKPEKGEGGDLALSDGAIRTITDTQKGLQGISSLQSMFGGGDYTGGVVQGNLRKLNPFDQSFKSQQAMVNTVRQFVGKALEGGVLRKEDEEKYRKILPTMQDDPNTAQSKLSYLQNMIETDLQNYSNLQRRYGKGAGQVDVSTMMSMGGGY